MPLQLQHVPLSLLQNKSKQEPSLLLSATITRAAHKRFLPPLPTATRMLRGCGQASPSGTLASTGPLNPSNTQDIPQEHPRISPTASRCSLGSHALAQAELAAKPSPTHTEKLFKRSLKLLLHPQSRVAATTDTTL